MRASIAIASHNEGDLLEKTVTSCLETTRGLDFEVVVADDASTDGSVEALRRRWPEIQMVSSPARQGVSATKDRAGRASRGDVIVFLDAHCKPDPGALERLVRDVEESAGQAVVTPKVGVLDVENWRCPDDHVGYGYRMDLAWFAQTWVGPEGLQVVQGPGGRSYLRQPAVMGCCLALARPLYETLWGFDTGMRSHGSEDVDFGLKSWLMGHPVWLDPEVLVGHRFRKGPGAYGVPPQHPLLNQLRMARKHFAGPVWEDWRDRQRRRYPEAVWSLAWDEFLETRASVERERDYLMANRRHDETWYATEFDLEWPRLGYGPGPEPPVPTTVTTHPSSPEPPKPPIRQQPSAF